MPGHWGLPSLASGNSSATYGKSLAQSLGGWGHMERTASSPPPSAKVQMHEWAPLTWHGAELRPTQIPNLQNQEQMNACCLKPVSAAAVKANWQRSCLGFAPNLLIGFKELSCQRLALGLDSESESQIWDSDLIKTFCPAHLPSFPRALSPMRQP